MIPVLVLNLARDTDRRAWITARLQSLGIPHTIVPAIDGNTIANDDALPDMERFRRSHGRAMTRGELGCARSHLRLVRDIAAGPDPMVCLMEDDIEIEPAALGFLDERTLTALPPFDVLRLFSDGYRRHKSAWRVSTVAGYNIVAPVRAGWGTQAQIYTREGACKVAGMPITAPIDNMIYLDHTPFGLRILEIRPSLVKVRDYGSGTSAYQKRRGIARTVYALKSTHHSLRSCLCYGAAWGMKGIAGLAFHRDRPT